MTQPVLSPTSPANQTAPSARVLVIDDEPLVGRAVARVLGTRHAVTITTSGRDALRRIEQGERYDVIFCDLMMPDLSGMELHRLLAERAPDVARRFVFLTGGAYTIEAQEFLDTSGAERIIKPFDPAALRLLVSSRAH